MHKIEHRTALAHENYNPPILHAFFAMIAKEFAAILRHLASIRSLRLAEFRTGSHYSRSKLSSRLLLLLVAALCSLHMLTSISIAEAETVRKRRRHLLDYEIQVNQFQDAVRPTVAAVQQCRVAQPQNRPNVCRTALRTIESNRKTLSRGYRDELGFLEGLCFEALGNDAKALAAYESSLEYEMTNADAIFRKGVVQERLGEFDKAIATMQEFLWISRTNQYEAQFIIGKALCSSKRCTQGLPKVEEALRANPRFSPAIHYLVEKKQERLALLKDPIKKAELEAQIAADLSRLVLIEPENREASLHLARYTLAHSDPLVHAQRLQEAQAMAASFVERSDYSDIEAVRLLFDIYIRRGQTQQAAEVLQKGLQKAPQASELLAAKKQLDIQKQVDALDTSASDTTP